MGAGAIGGYVGVRAAAAGCTVVMVGRPELCEMQSILQAVDLDGRTFGPSDRVRVTTEVQALADVDVCLLTTKSKDSTSSAQALVDVLSPGTPVVSLQNGLENPNRLRAAGLTAVVPGLVTFNVVRDGACFRQATSGPIASEAGDSAPAVAELARLLREVPWVFRPELASMQAGKLLLNLNNGVCAAAGVTVANSLRARPLRRVYGLCLREGIQVLRAADQPFERIGRLSPALIARLLGLPDFIFFQLARQMITIDPRAKSSTLQDLERGRPTEIDDLNGAIVRLGRAHGVPTPANSCITETIRTLEGAETLAHPTPEALLRACRPVSSKDV